MHTHTHAQIQALESDLSTSNILANEVEKQRDECQKGREQTLELLSKSIDEKAEET